ncbi:hypothetical protein HXX76_009485 [Chlamydomonas incerta]|uniref:Gamma-butyrobetaine hydroxylase-like N-terminal domain-containing protein n=1 Tax=Chlamydomonas incerta TaxID=51695 RepID=A0A835W0A3_CHLIN|nr:hypothetical protein HXX76_009485 [Chlamydomonas incerta]|eukprot:KAG2431471.1 hypothetical protein HXX76_009485 [Chlamydomonas incerta]
MGFNFYPSADTKRVDPRTGLARVVAGRRHVGILRVEPLGNYAIRIHFDDLHASGIFTWDYLARLGGAGRWPAMREYLRLLRAAGLSRDPGRKPLPPPPFAQQQQQQQPEAARSCGGGARGSGGSGTYG